MIVEERMSDGEVKWQKQKSKKKEKWPNKGRITVDQTSLKNQKMNRIRNTKKKYKWNERIK